MLTFVADAGTVFQAHCVGAYKAKLLKVVESTFFGQWAQLTCPQLCWGEAGCTGDSQAPTPTDARGEILESLQWSRCKIPIYFHVFNTKTTFYFLAHYFMCISSGTNYSSPVYIHQLWGMYSRVLPGGLFSWLCWMLKMLKVNLVLTEVLRWSRQCSRSSYNVVQGCVAVVYLSSTMLWHGLGSDTSHNPGPLWVKTAPLHGLVNLIVILEVIKTVERILHEE